MNRDTIVLSEARSARYFFRGQAGHAAGLLLLLVPAWAFAGPSIGDGAWLGIPDFIWFWGAISLAVLQQLVGWLVFRAQLGWGTLTRWFGKKDLAVWGFLFFPLLIIRPVMVFGLAVSDRGSLQVPVLLSAGLGVILLVPAVYTIWSVERYFGVARALGGDHFRLRYRRMPLVREGAFRFSKNAMYSFAFFALWTIALLFRSQAGLSLALFEHAYVWVHYYATEKPDMQLLYGSGSPAKTIS